VTGFSSRDETTGFGGDEIRESQRNGSTEINYFQDKSTTKKERTLESGEWRVEKKKDNAEALRRRGFAGKRGGEMKQR
jgi:hypothetical protein